MVYFSFFLWIFRWLKWTKIDTFVTCFCLRLIEIGEPLKLLVMFMLYMVERRIQSGGIDFCSSRSKICGTNPFIEFLSHIDGGVYRLCTYGISCPQLVMPRDLVKSSRHRRTLLLLCVLSKLPALDTNRCAADKSMKT